MDYFLICAAAFLTSGLTLFSGFGLGTLLTPVFAVFFPVGAAVALTAIVHFLNNLFKLALVGKKADKSVVLRFGAPALLAAFAGAWLLSRLSALAPLARYEAFGRTWEVLPVKLAVGALMVVFALLDALPRLQNLSFDKKWLPLGGAASGFFGGLSGHQGALRSAFLIRCGLSNESFIATGVVTACLVDATRLTVYAGHLSALQLKSNAGILAAATFSAFLGAWIGSRLMHKVTIRAVRNIVAVLLITIAIALMAGVI